MYGPILPDPVLLSHPWSKERHGCQSRHRESTSHSHRCSPQLPGDLDGTAARLCLVLITTGFMAKEILEL